MEQFTAIVLSAGRGSRMKSEQPKQYMDLNGKPVIYYALKAFEDSEVSSIVLVVGEGDEEYAKTEIVERYGFRKVKAIVPGGKERYQSVYEGLKAAKGADFVLVHDGARPMIDQKILQRAMNCVRETKACVVAMPVKDTIRVVARDRKTESTPQRETLWAMQTPQCFSYNLIMGAYSHLYADQAAGKYIPTITDDAMVVEYGIGTPSTMVEGSYRNIKITTPEDLEVARAFLKSQAD